VQDRALQVGAGSASDRSRRFKAARSSVQLRHDLLLPARKASAVCAHAAKPGRQRENTSSGDAASLKQRCQIMVAFIGRAS
jgi:hypothetical protein